MYHDRDFSLLEHLLPARPFVVDVGANRGQSVNSIRHARPDAVIHSFEPNPEFRGVLAALQSAHADVHIHNVGLGSQAGVVKFYIPVVNGVRYEEEATMRLAALEEPWVVEKFRERGGQVEFELFEAQVAVGDHFGFAPSLIKIDVEGVESEVVRGFLDTIREHSPILLTGSTRSSWNSAIRA
jgi:FkbM family methyltransferase